MAVYWLSFTLDSDEHDGRDYQERWDQLYDAVTKITKTYWTETAAFAVFSSDLNIDEVSATIGEAVAPEHDIVLIRNMDAKIARIFGPVKDNDIFGLMPYLRRA